MKAPTIAGTMLESDSGKGPKRAYSGADNWIGVQDARSRKVIQDRLAQRARRKRLAEAKAAFEAKKSTRIDTSEPVKIAPKVAHSLSSEIESPLPDRLVVEAEQHYTASKSSTQGDLTSRPSWQSDFHTHPRTDPYFITMPTETLFSALYNNGRLLGISCINPLPRRSPPGDTDLPFPLHPVELQMDVLHHPYIDCLPIPKLRHNLIFFAATIDNDEFCRDLVSPSNFTVIGNQSWDPSGWVMSSEFRKKWEFLFDW
ncbi:hypothetical protein F5884DRAFT_848785 [Xylogone sp. PMI_703]|nr:hypothetical protein F5884DRAFT_848785 [Xylogone sp. PMI_703]